MNDFVHCNQSLEGLYFVGQYGLNTEASPKGHRRMIVPSVHDTFYEASEQVAVTVQSISRTSDVFLLRCCLLWTCSFLDVYDEFMVGLVLVDWASGIVDFVAINVVVLP